VHQAANQARQPGAIEVPLPQPLRRLHPIPTRYPPQGPRLASNREHRGLIWFHAVSLPYPRTPRGANSAAAQKLSVPAWYARLVAGIGALNETPLHAALKHAVAPAGARFEVPVEGYVIDAVHQGLLIEIQTRHVGQMRKKLERLLANHRVRLVLPVTETTWILKRGPQPSRRRSPKRGHPADVARELVAIPDLLTHPNLEFELVLIHAEEVREHQEGVAWRRRGWVTVDRHLLQILEQRRWSGAAGLLSFLPSEQPTPFGSADLAAQAGMGRRSAQALLYCLRHIGAITEVAKAGNARHYTRTPALPN